MYMAPKSKSVVKKPVVEVVPDTLAEVSPVVEVADSPTLLLTKLVELKADMYVIHKRLLKNLSTVLKLHEKKCKELKKQNSKNRVRVDLKDTKRAPSGFAKPTVISKKLADFMGVPRGQLVARTTVTKYVTTYIKEHNLQVTDNRRSFKPDKKLQSILSPLDKKRKDKQGVSDVKKGYTYFNLQRYLSSQFPKN